MNWEGIRQWLRAERTLLRELALMLLVALVVGLYFLEHLDNRLQERERVHAQAQAHQVAGAAAEYLAAEDRVSLTVLARRSAALAPVARVELRGAEGDRMLAEHGAEATPEMLEVQRPVGLGDGDVIGMVRLWLEPSDELRARLEAGFVLVVLCLLGLRVVAGFLYRRVSVAAGAERDRARETGDPVRTAGAAASELPGRPVAATAARLWVVPANRRHLEQRYTPSLLRELLADHRDCLERVARLYGGRPEGTLESGMTVVFDSGPAEEAVFSALCAGQLFLELGRRLNRERRREGRPPLEFKLLAGSDQDAESARYFCENGWPGRVQMLLSELEALRLDTRVLYRESQALVIMRDGEEIRVQPVEQLAQRYQKLVEDQAARLEQATEGGDTA